MLSVFKELSCSFRSYCIGICRHFTMASGLKMQSTATLSTSGGKPPNVLVFQPNKDTTSEEFIRVRDSLESCLAPEHYVIYPLGVDDITQYSPWKENCRLLVFPSSLTRQPCHEGSNEPSISSRVIEEVVTYVQRGGKLLSMHSELNKYFGLSPLQYSLPPTGSDGEKSVFHVYCRDDVCDVSVEISEGEDENGGQNYRFSSLVPIFDKSGSESDAYLKDLLQKSVESSQGLAFLVPLEWNADMEWIEKNTNSNNSQLDQHSMSHDLEKVPCVSQIELTNEGHAVISTVDLLPTLPNGLDVAPLVRLKKGVALRERYFSHLLRSLGVECGKGKLPELSHTFLLCSEEHRSSFLSAMDPLLSNSIILGKDLSLYLILTDYTLGTPVDVSPQPSASQLTIVTKPALWQVKDLPFSYEKYFQELQTREIGRTLLYTPVITSTQEPFNRNFNFCHALRAEMGVVWVASQQTKGKGRGSNRWISPLGCMMFSMSLLLPPSSRLAHHVSLIQHLIAVAVVHGIRSLPGYEDVPLRIKWPNDIYYKRTVKLGGILVSCLSMGNDSSHTAIIGCGVNINNQHPTMSVNDAISLYNKETGHNLPPLSIEGVLASTFNCFEGLLSVYEVQGLEGILKLYYNYWLHSNATVSLSNYGEEAVVVVGIDKYGYLRVKKKDGDVLSLQPDGNSYDIMKGLIVKK